MINDTPAPDYAHVVLVPVANPATARNLIQLGKALAHPEKGRVIPVTISVGNGDAERDAEAIEQLEPVCEELSEEGREIELKTVTAPSVARGILDTIREENADLVILGLNRPTHGEAVIGAIPESVAETAPCDVLIYRDGLAGGEFERVVVPANGSDHARVASRVAILTGQSYDKPVEAIYVQPLSGGSYWAGRGRLEETLLDVPGQEIVKRTLVTAQNPTRGILARVEETDLLVVGYSRRSELHRWLYGNFSRELLNRAPGPVLLVARMTDPLTDDTLIERLWRWARPTLTHVEQGELARAAEAMASASLDYTVLILISAILASFGLLINSGAVIIGAMLVAPLMSPLIGFSVGMATGRIPLVRRASLSVVQGFVLALAIAFFVGAISPTNIVTDEMASRGNPTVMDMGVALASGFIGAYATARKDIPSALAGVAIAAALMPPACTIGLGIAYHDMALARGATLLFATNIVSIILAAWAVFFWLGLRPRIVEDSRARLYTSAVMVLIFAGILTLLFTRDVNPRRFEAGIEQTLEAAFQQDQLVNFEVRRGDRLQVVAIIRRSQDRIDDNTEVIVAQRALRNLLDDAELDVVIQPFLNADHVLAERTLSSFLSPIFVMDILFNPSDEALQITATVPAASYREARALTEEAQSVLEEALGTPVILRIIIDDGPSLE